MGKGAATRKHIVGTALAQARQVGLESVTLGTLADELKLSKSGLFAHFRSKQALQLAVLEQATERFIARVVRPALAAPRGEPRLAAVVSGWIQWFRDEDPARGCVFLSLASEYDDRPGPVRDAVVRSQREWLDFLAGAARLAIAAGHFRADLDPTQFAFEFVGIGMTLQYAAKLVGDPAAETRARAAFDDLLTRARSRSER